MSATSLSASTGFIQGVIKSLDGGTIIIEGLNHYKKDVKEVADHKIPGKGTPIYILDGRITTKEAALKVGRQAFIFWNRHTQQMVVVRSGKDETGVEYPAGPTPEGVYINTTQGVIKSATKEAVVFDVGGEEKSVPLKSGKTGLSSTPSSTRRSSRSCSGKHAVVFCYRNASTPTSS